LSGLASSSQVEVNPSNKNIFWRQFHEILNSLVSLSQTHNFRAVSKSNLLNLNLAWDLETDSEHQVRFLFKEISLVNTN
jgi:hypothetical protein